MVVNISSDRILSCRPKETGAAKVPVALLAACGAARARAHTITVIIHVTRNVILAEWDHWYPRRISAERIAPVADDCLDGKAAATSALPYPTLNKSRKIDWKITW